MLQAALPTGCYTTNNAYNQYPKFLTAEQATATPDFAANLGYRGFITPSGNVGHYYCFFNPQDYALATGTVLWGTLAANWEANEVSYKPDSSPGYSPISGGTSSGRFYAMQNGQPIICDSAPGGGYQNVDNVTEIHESMSFLARPRSQAVGADPNSPAVFGAASSTNLQAMYGFGGAATDHSGQFLRPYYQVYLLYQKFDEIIAPP